MPTTVTYVDKSLPDGTEVAVTGLPCLFLNNQPVEVDDDSILQYEKSTGDKFADLLISKKFGGPGRPKSAQEDTPPVVPLDTKDAEADKIDKLLNVKSDDEKGGK